LVLLLIDRVIVTDGDVEIRYVVPTSPASEHIRFCHLRTDYFDHPAMAAQPLAGLDALAGDAGNDAPLPAGTAAAVVIITLVGMQFGWALTWSAAPPPKRRNRVKRLFQHLGVMHIGG
jgi:site-specific DNA recombinase